MQHAVVSFILTFIFSVRSHEECHLMALYENSTVISSFLWSIFLPPFLWRDVQFSTHFFIYVPIKHEQ